MHMYCVRLLSYRIITAVTYREGYTTAKKKSLSYKEKFDSLVLDI